MDATPLPRQVVAETTSRLPDGAVSVTQVATSTWPPPPPPLTIGVVGFGNFGQFLAATFVKQGHRVIGMSRGDYTAAATALGATYTRNAADLMAHTPDVVIFCTSIMSLASVLGAFPVETLASTLVVDVLSVKVHAAKLLTAALPPTADILCTHPMFGPESGRAGWGGLPFVYDRVRVGAAGQDRCNAFLRVWAAEGCRMVEMGVATHDAYAASTQFITHTTGRLLAGLGVGPTPINTKGYESLLGVVDTTIKDSFDLYYGLYKYNPAARTELDRLEASFAAIRSRLDACEAAEKAAEAGAAGPDTARPAAAGRGGGAAERPAVVAAAAAGDPAPATPACNGNGNGVVGGGGGGGGEAGAGQGRPGEAVGAAV